MENTINPKTPAITSSAINMPRQLRCDGDTATSSCKINEKTKMISIKNCNEKSEI